MKTRITLTVLFVFLSSIAVFSQEKIKQNNRYINSLTIPSRFDVDIWSMEQSQRKEMFFATRRGILMYDGLSWQLIKTQNIPLVLKFSDINGKIYVGCHSDFGVLELNDSLGYVYKSLAENKNINSPISRIITSGEKLIFYSATTAFLIENGDEQIITPIKQMDNSYFKGYITHQANVYFLNQKNELFLLKNKLLQKTNLNLPQTHNQEIVFSVQQDANNTIIGLSDNALYKFDGKKLLKFSTNVDAFIHESVIQKGINIDDKNLAVSTIAGGVLVIDKQTGKLQFTLNYNTGLPDDEIYGIFLDSGSGLWISHQFGISRVDLQSPISDYSHYPGLDGRVIAVSVLDSVPYVATTTGLYYLKELTSVKEARQMIKNNKNTKEIRKEENQSEQRFFKRLFSKKKAEEAVNDLASLFGKDTEDSISVTVENTNADQPKYRSSQELLELLPLTYAFALVQNISVKTRQIIPFENQLLVATNQGLFVVEKGTAQKISDPLYINHMVLHQKQKLLFVATNEGILVLKKERNTWNKDYLFNKYGPTYSLAFQNDTLLWAGIEGMTFYLKFNNGKYENQSIPEKFDIAIPEKVVVRNINDTVYFILNDNLYLLQQNKIVPTDQIAGIAIRDQRLLMATNDNIWLMNQNNKTNLMNRNIIQNQLKYLNLFDDYQDIYPDQQQNLWILTQKDQLLCIQQSAKNRKFNDFNIFISRITAQNGKVVNGDNIKLGYDNNALLVELSAPFFAKNNAIEYQYFISGFSRTWSLWQHEGQINIEMLPAGTYKLLIRARNILGQEYESELITFSVMPPWWMKTVSIVAFILLAIALISYVVYSFMKSKQAKLQREKQILEQRVQERTHELAEKNKEITDSINYARNIQTAVLPPVSSLNKKVSDYFILNKPRDIVSGDFYWMTDIGDKTIVVAADCTGHGVPGAFMSMLGVSFLNEIVKQKGITDAAEILNKLRASVIQALRQTEEGNVQKDGMDISLVTIDRKNMKMQYAGAYNSILVFSGGQLNELQPDKMPIGIHRKYETPFSQQLIDIKKGDTVFMFSDGFMDQFGGPKNRKYLKSRFRETLQSIHQLSAEEQKQKLEQEYTAWKGSEPQIDDVLIIGLKI